MHLNEFSDPKVYTLSAGDMASILKQLENIWFHRGLKDDSPLIDHLTKKPEDRRRKLMEKWRRDGIRRPSRRRRFSTRRWQ
jgi:hypothetical protein